MAGHAERVAGTLAMNGPAPICFGAGPYLLLRELDRTTAAVRPRGQNGRSHMGQSQTGSDDEPTAAGRALEHRSEAFIAARPIGGHLRGRPPPPRQTTAARKKRETRRPPRPAAAPPTPWKLHRKRMCGGGGGAQPTPAGPGGGGGGGRRGGLGGGPPPPPPPRGPGPTGRDRPRGGGTPPGGGPGPRAPPRGPGGGGPAAPARPRGPRGPPPRAGGGPAGGGPAERGGGLVGARGFEPPTSSSRTMRATKLRHAPTEGAR